MVGFLIFLSIWIILIIWARYESYIESSTYLDSYLTGKYRYRKVKKEIIIEVEKIKGGKKVFKKGTQREIKYLKIKQKYNE